MTPTLDAEKNALLRKWKDSCRSNLLELEKKSINVRVSVFEKILNEKTVQVNRMLCFNGEEMKLVSPYKHYTDIEQHIKFIENWNGLNTNQMRSLPKSLPEYENRAKNWLNGRRAINYAQNLFPEMILCAEHYSNAIADKLKLIKFHNDDKQKELYREILLFAFIAGICGGRVALYDGHHRASLICENSIKKEGNLKRLLQKYFDGAEEDSYTFPKHLQAAIDFFKNKYHEKLNQFQTQYTHKQFYENKNKKKQNTDSGNSPSVKKSNSVHTNYAPQRGGSHIGSSSNFRTNPLRQNHHQNNNNNVIELPSLPQSQQQQQQHQQMMNNMMLMQQQQQQHEALMNNHRSTISNLVQKMNDIQRRNAYLQQEVQQYREQSSLDREKIKLLEDQIALLQSNSYNAFNDPSRSSPSTSLITNNPSTTSSNDDMSSFFASSSLFSNENNLGGPILNDDTNTMILPEIPLTNNHHHNTMNMNINNGGESPMPINTLGLNFEHSFNPTNHHLNLHNNASSHSLFGPIGPTTGEYELDNMDNIDYSHMINSNFV